MNCHRLSFIQHFFLRFDLDHNRRTFFIVCFEWFSAKSGNVLSELFEKERQLRMVMFNNMVRVVTKVLEAED